MKIQFHTKLKSYLAISILLFQILYPSVSYGISDSPDQPEYGSYEDFNSTDMVNLITGDFSYNIPLLNVPSPEGGYQVPLTYHAGIQTNEEASWVGLGWNLNAGVLSRQVSIYPDDFSGENISSNVSNPGGSGWVKTFPMYTQYYDSERGRGGQGNVLGIVTWGTGFNKNFGFAPVGLTLKDGKVSYDLTYNLSGIASSISLFSAIYTGGVTLVAYAAQEATSESNNMLTTHSSYFSGGSGSWQVEKDQGRGFLGGSIGRKTAVKYFLNNNQTEARYGSLYLGDMPINSSNPRGNATVAGGIASNSNLWNEHELFAHNGTSWGTDGNDKIIRDYSVRGTTNAMTITNSDMFIHYDQGENYAWNENPVNIAYDKYNVKAPGVGGSIEPYRADMGTLAHSASSTGFIFQGSLVGPQYLDNMNETNGQPNYKVQFKYSGDFSNSYTYHNRMANGDLTKNDYDGQYEIDNPAQPSPGFEHRFRVLFKNQTARVNYPSGVFTINNTGGGVSSPAYSSGYSLTDKYEADRNGLVSKNLITKKHIQWYNNAEIHTGAATQNGLLKSQPNNAYLWSSSRPINSQGIGAFSVTNEAGFTYHFTLPVYARNKITVNRDLTSNTTYQEIDNNWYATSWLLTGITGPDFVDRANNGTIDANDWGYWVKFEYGKFASNFGWRNPYYYYSGDNQSRSYQLGKVETYYLDKIITRSHTALFVKSPRVDRKGFYESSATDAYGVSVLTEPSSSLKLNDIYVIDNTDHDLLFGSTASGGKGLTLANPQNYSPTLKNGDVLTNVLDSFDLEVNTNIKSFLQTSQLEKIHFEYDNSLCNKTYNSFKFDQSGNSPSYYADQGAGSPNLLLGKLKLKSVEVFGKNNVRVMPSYIFKYGDDQAGNYTQTSGHNPDYHPWKYDGWGMYKSGADDMDYTPHNSELKGDQWCLTEIITPMGAKIKVNYERDDYTNVNGYPISNSPLNFKTTTTSLSTGQTQLVLDARHYGTTSSSALGSYIAVNQPISFPYVIGTSNFGTWNSIITQINGNVITIQNTPGAGQTLNLFGEVSIGVTKKYGGDLRVSDINIVDELNRTYTTKYIYTKNGESTGISSGVAGFEPKSDRGTEFPFYKNGDHPYTPILYSNVTVVNGINSNGQGNERSKYSVHFVTPDKNFLTTLVESGGNNSGNIYRTHAVNSGQNFIFRKHFRFLGRNISKIDNTSKIGAIDTVKSYNQFNNCVSKTYFEYTDNSTDIYANKLGHYTENSLMWEFMWYDTEADDHKYDRLFMMRFFQHYKLKRPNILKSVTTIKDRLTSKKEIISYDYFTGQPLVTRNTLGNIEKYEEQIVPAYTKYPALASKTIDKKNKNMMVALAEQRAYVYNSANQAKLLDATVMTYANDQNYRDFNNGSYVNQPYSGSNIYDNTWLPKTTYHWKSKIKHDGTIDTTFASFNHSSPQASDKHWIKTGEIDLLDHYSHTLQSSNIDNQKTSVKYGYNNRYPVASCNMPYGTWCHGTAEDIDPLNAAYFSGETQGTNKQFKSSVYSHTGDYCLKLGGGNQSSGGFSFVLKRDQIPSVGTSVDSYQASVWVHQANGTNAILWCLPKYNGQLCGGGAVLAGFNQTPDPTKFTIEHIGAFYRYTVFINLLDPQYNSCNELEFFVTNNTPVTPPAVQQPIYIDDFRVHPSGASLTASVNDPKTGKVLAVLDNDNMATKFVYNAAGQLTNVYKETKNGFKIVSSSKVNYKR